MSVLVGEYHIQIGYYDRDRVPNVWEWDFIGTEEFAVNKFQNYRKQPHVFSVVVSKKGKRKPLADWFRGSRPVYNRSKVA